MPRATVAACRSRRVSGGSETAVCVCVGGGGGGHGIETVEEAREALGIWVDRWGEEPGYGGLVDSADYT